MNPAPIALFVYNRPWHTRQTIRALKKNKLAADSELFIFADGSRNHQDYKSVESVRDIIKECEGFKRVTVHTRKENKGLAGNIIDGVTRVVCEYERVIVLEDDLVSSPYFLGFMNRAIDCYANQHRVFCISGYNLPPKIMKIPARYPYDTYFNYRMSSQGWATWADRWQLADWDISDFDDFMSNREQRLRFSRGGDDLLDLLILQMEGKINSWAIRWIYTNFKHDALTLYPIHSYINNIGHDGSGTHCRMSDLFHNNLRLSVEKPVFPPDLQVDENMMRALRKGYRPGPIARLRKTLTRLTAMVKK